jgi:hypothetical protein
MPWNTFAVSANAAHFTLASERWNASALAPARVTVSTPRGAISGRSNSIVP